MPQKKRTPAELIAKLRQVETLMIQGKSVAEALPHIRDTSVYINSKHPILND